MDSARDLFGQISVTIDDLASWVRAVAPHMARNAQSLSHYIRWWNVATKVATAKADGSFYSITGPSDDETARIALLLQQATARAETTTGQ